MCGLVGIATSFAPKWGADAFTDLLYVSGLRGYMSTGIARFCKSWANKNAENNGNSYAWIKNTVTPLTFLQFKETQDFVRDSQVRALIGHTRAPTHGEVKVENAHPFETEEGLIGVHNGTIHGTFPFREQFETDSEALYNFMSKEGEDEALSHVTSKGAFALVWFDKRDATLNFVRNEDRPLYMAWEKRGDALLWASEEGMINLAASRNKIDLQSVWMLRPNCLYSLPIGERSRWEKPEIIDDFVRKRSTYVYPNAGAYAGKEAWDEAEAWGRAFPPVRAPGATGGLLPAPKIEEGKSALTVIQPPAKDITPHHVGKGGSEATKGKGEVVNINKSSNGVEKKGKKGEKQYKGFAGKLYTKDEYYDVLAEGCSWCTGTLIKETGEPEEHQWISFGEAVCMDCAQTREVIKYRSENVRDFRLALCDPRFRDADNKSNKYADSEEEEGDEEYQGVLNMREAIDEILGTD